MSNTYEIAKEDTNAGVRGDMVLVNGGDFEPRDSVELVEDHLVADAVIAHPLIPHRPSVVLVVADDGVGKTALLCQVAAAVSGAGKKVLYICGEDNPEKLKAMVRAAAGDLSRVAFVDCVVDHADVELRGMLEHAAVAPLVNGVDSIIIETLSSFESEGIKRRAIRGRLKQFHAMARNGVTTYIAMHPNRARTHVRRPAHRVPAGWGGAVEDIWMIEPSDDQGHAVLEMVRGRDYEKPWDRYPYWVSNADGVKLAVIDTEGKNTGPTIADLLEEKNPKHLPKGVLAALRWLRDYLVDGPKLINLIEQEGKAAGHSLSNLRRAKYASKGGIEDRKRLGDGLSEWFLRDEQLDQVAQPVEPAEPCHYTPKHVMDAIHAVFGPCDLDPCSPPEPVHVQARNWFTKEQDGLKQSWAIPKGGWLFCNPPWGRRGRPEIPAWATKALAEIDAGHVARMIMLLPFWRTNSFDKLRARGMTVLDIGKLAFGQYKGVTEKGNALFLHGFTSAAVAELVASLRQHGVKVDDFMNGPPKVPM